MKLSYKLLKSSLYLLIFIFIISISFSNPTQHVKYYNENNVKTVTNFLSGITSYEDKDFSSACSFFEKALKNDPDNNYIKLKYAQGLIHQKKINDAFNILIPLSEQNTNVSAKADIILASILLSQDKNITAVSFLNHALSLNLKEKNIYIALSKLYENLNLISEAINTNEKAVKLFSDDLRFLLKAAELLFINKNFEKALYYFEQALNIKDNDIKILHGIALCHKNLKDNKKAIKYLEKVILIDPLSYPTYIELITLKIQEKEWEEAFKDCEVYMTLSKNFIQGISLYTNISLSSKQIERGIKLLERYSDLFSNNGDYYFFLATLYKDKQDVAKALDAYQKSIEFSNPKHIVLFYYSKFLYEQNQIENAIKNLKLSISINSTFAKSLNFLGYILLETKNTPINEAIALIESALKQEPDNPAYLDSMGWALYKKGKLKEALFYQNEAIKRSDDKIIFEHLNTIKEAINNTKETEEKTNTEN